MGLPVWNISFILSAFIVGTAAEYCSYSGFDYYCIFGCCSGDLLYAYCCLSNGAGISIICAAIVVFLSIIAICLRRRRVLLNQQFAATRACQGQTTCVSTVSSYPGTHVQQQGAPPPYKY